MKKRNLPPSLESALVLGGIGLVFSLAWLVLDEQLASLCVGMGAICMLYGVASSLWGLKAKPVLASACFIGIGGALFASVSLFTNHQDFRMNHRIADIQGRVEGLRDRLGDQKAIQAVLASPSDWKKYNLKASDIEPPAISFLVVRRGLDNGANLVFDPSYRIERFFAKDGKFDKSDDWKVYEPLVLYDPVSWKKLGEGWYLIHFT